jgi:hypothetical protein
VYPLLGLKVVSRCCDEGVWDTKDIFLHTYNPKVDSITCPELGLPLLELAFFGVSNGISHGTKQQGFVFSKCWMFSFEG